MLQKHQLTSYFAAMQPLKVICDDFRSSSRHLPAVAGQVWHEGYQNDRMEAKPQGHTHTHAYTRARTLVAFTYEGTLQRNEKQAGEN